MARSNRREDTEGKIRAVTLALIAERGLTGFTLKDVAARAGTSHGLAGHYFPTKTDLIDAVVSDLLSSAAPVSAIEPALALEALLQGVRDTIAATMSDVVRARALFVVLGMIEAASPYRSRIVAHHNRALDRIEAHIVGGISAGHIRDDVDPRLQAFVVLATLRGVAFLVLSTPRRIDLVRAADQATENLRRALVAAGTEDLPSRGAADS
jgi:AcrR family transcriptional regulator